MPGQAEYSSLPSLEVSPVITPPKTETFSDTLMKKILQSHPDINPELTQEILLKTEKTNTLTIEQQQHLDTILSILLQHPNSYNILSLPSYIKTITKDIKNNSIQGDTNLYINNLIGGQKTLEEITQTQEEQTIDKKEQTIDKKEQNINQKEQNINQKEQNINQKEQNINQTNQEKTQINQEKVKILKTIADNINSVDLSKTSITYTYDYLAKNPATKKALDTFKEALGYNTGPGEGLTGAELKENQRIEQKAIAYINYNILLQKKIKNGESISEQARSQAKQFSEFLKASDIDENEFYNAFETNNWRGKRPTIEIENKSGESELSRTSSRNEAPSLANDLSNDENIDTSNLHVEGLFEDINDETLMAQFPYPPGESKTSFILPENSAKVIKMAEDINTNRLKYPLIDGATKDEKKKQIAKKDALLRHILMTNPDKKIPPYIIKKIYPDISITDKTNRSEIQKAERRNPRINGIRQRILNNSRNQNREFLLERGSLLGLMKNNFIHPSVEQSFANRIQKGYLSYVSNILKQTPGLEDIKYNPKEIIITNNKVTLPLHLRDMDKTDAIITIENGKVSISNTLYNPSDTNNINQITKGTVTVGTIKDFDAFTKESTKIIPELITQHTQIQAPQVQYTEQFQNHIGEVIKEQNDDTIGLQASIAHNISHNKVRDMTKELMYNWNNDGNQPPSETQKNSPFYQELHDYEQSEDKKITKESNPDTFDSLQLLRTTMLKNSAQDNIILKDSLSKLNTLITDKSFTSNLANYLSSTSQHDETPKNSLLLALHAPNRTQSNPEAKQALPLLLKLFSTQYENYNNPNNTIDTKAFQQTIDQLASGTSFDVVNINHIASTNPAVEKIYTTYNKNNEIQHIEDDLNNAYE